MVPLRDSVVDFSSNNLGPEGARFVGHGVKIADNLQTLRLSNNKLGETGAAYIREAIRKTTTLTSLDLVNTGLGVRGAGYIAYATQFNHALKHVSTGSRAEGRF